jgi:transposase-like protein
MNRRRSIEVSIDDQELRVLEASEIIARFPVSTSAKGTGFKEGSLRTPVGRFRIARSIGEGEPWGTIFKGRVPVGLWQPGDGSAGDLVLTRILTLDGLDKRNANTLSRFIYIHGTNDEQHIGQPASHGCVRLRNDDMIRLFELMTEGDEVHILPAGKHHCRVLRRMVNPAPDGDSLPSNRGNSNKSAQFVLDSSFSEILNSSPMSAKSKSSSRKRVRYTDAQKKEILDFINQYNATNGRGGQSAAAKKFGVTPITLSAWTKAAGGGKAQAKAKKPGRKASKKSAKKAAGKPKAAKAPGKAAKSAKSGAKGGRGSRYSADFKREVVDFVNSHNAANGRGGQSAASRKFKISILTVSSWLKKGGAKVKPGRKVASAKAATGKGNAGLAAKVKSLIQLGAEVRKAEANVEQLRAKYDALSASIRSSI